MFVSVCCLMFFRNSSTPPVLPPSAHTQGQGQAPTLSAPPSGQTAAVPPGPPPPPPPIQSTASPVEKQELVVTLPPLQKGWAKGSRLVFLTDRLPGYKAALQTSRTKATDYADATYTLYDSIYPWDLPLDLEPLPAQLPLPLPLPLTPYEEAHKRAEIKRMRKVS